MAANSSDSNGQSPAKTVATLVSKFGNVVKEQVREVTQQARQEVRQGLADLREDLDEELHMSKEAQQALGEQEQPTTSEGTHETAQESDASNEQNEAPATDTPPE